MGQVLQELERSPGLYQFVQERAPKCLLCTWIGNDLREKGKLTGWPFDSFGKSDFPVSSKLRHLILEFGEAPPENEKASEDDLASVVQHLMDTVLW